MVKCVHVNCYGLPVIAMFFSGFGSATSYWPMLWETSESYAKSENCLRITCASKRCYGLRWFQLCDLFCVFACCTILTLFEREVILLYLACVLATLSHVFFAVHVFSLRITLSKWRVKTRLHRQKSKSFAMAGICRLHILYMKGSEAGRCIHNVNKISCRHNGVSFVLCYGFWSSVMVWGGWCYGMTQIVVDMYGNVYKVLNHNFYLW